MFKAMKFFVNFYGTDDKRRVEIKGPYILENNEDGSMKTVLTQEVYKLSGDELEKQFFIPIINPLTYIQ